MRLLIVEDEFYTRQGIMEDIDLAGIGFDAVQQADDGVNGLKMARTFKPDVVLADVRMPRMDGVEMCYSLRRFLPGCTIVFMSGYADKEYLKAAIDLKATSYIEKPFRSRELREVLDRAATLRRQEQERERRESELLQRADASAPLLRSRAAVTLVQHDLGDPLTQQAISVAEFPVTEEYLLAVALVRSAEAGFGDEAVLREALVSAVARAAVEAGLRALTAVRGDAPSIVVLAADPSRRKALGEKESVSLLDRILRSVPGQRLVAGIGGPAAGPGAGRTAFASASSALEAAFFLGAGAVCHDQSAGRASLSNDLGSIDAFQASLDREDGAAALACLRQRAQEMSMAATRDAPQAREYLTRLLLRLVAFCERRGIDPFADGESIRRLSDTIERAGTLQTAAAVVEAASGRAFERLAEHAAEGRVVSEIKRAIHRAYGMPGLSIDGIAAEVRVSPTYACRLFKERTGETIHGYITAYRVERAKDLLLDARGPKMIEVAERAGFSDANYFARAFRRATGRSPSEFREAARR